MEDREDRNGLWQPQALQQRIADARVVIGGLGGLGWLIGSALVGVGVRHLELFDPDVLSACNFNRLWGCGRHQIGQPKVQIFSDAARGIDAGIRINAHQEAIPSLGYEHALAKADVVFGGFDFPEPRLATQVLALKSGVLYIDSGVAIQSTEDGFKGYGQVFFSKDRSAGCIVCAGMRADALGYRGDGPGPQASSGVLNGIVANAAVTMWVQHLLGETVPPMTLFNWNQLSLRPLKELRRRPQCPICGPAPAWTRPLGGEHAESRLS